MSIFSNRIKQWMLTCFGLTIMLDIQERCHRFLEEALELVQSLGVTAEECHKLVDYVFGRPLGHPPQEVGGVEVTLEALCIAANIDRGQAGFDELRRIERLEVMERIRAKQASKPKFSPLPGVYSDREEAGKASSDGGISVKDDDLRWSVDADGMTVTYGYDNVEIEYKAHTTFEDFELDLDIDERDFKSTEEKIRLANQMIARWNKYKSNVQGSSLRQSPAIQQE